MNPSGRKYLRQIRGFTTADFTTEAAVHVDVYAVLLAFGVTDPAVQHAVKKLLCAGARSKGSYAQDLSEARDCVDRALELSRPVLCTTPKSVPSPIPSMPAPLSVPGPLPVVAPALPPKAPSWDSDANPHGRV